MNKYNLEMLITQDISKFETNIIVEQTEFSRLRIEFSMKVFTNAHERPTFHRKYNAEQN